MPIDLDFDEELFFDLVDKDRAKLPPNERKPYKYLMDAGPYPYRMTPLDFIHPYSYFCGVWFNLEYFKDIEPIIRAEFSLKTPLNPTNATLKNRILQTQDSVFLHIRRGDYLKHTDFYLNLKGEYYGGAINYLKTKLSKPYIFIFSNDILWCEREFLATLSDKSKEDVEFEFVKNNGEDNAVQEMELMRSCKHAITTNSTFSWWASYLIDNPHKIVLMPNCYGSEKIFPTINYDDKTQMYEGVVLVDAFTGELV